MLKIFLLFNVITLFFSLFLKVDFLISFFCFIALSIQWLYAIKIKSFSGIDLMGILFPLAFIIKIIFSKELSFKKNIFYLDNTITIFYILILSLFLSGLLPLAVGYHEKSFLDAITAWAKYSTGFVVFIFFVLYVENKEKFLRVCKFFSLTLLLPAIYFIWQIFTGDLIRKATKSMPSVGFHNPHIITYAIVLVLPLLYFLFFIEEKILNRIIYFISAILLLIIAYLSYARTGWLAIFTELFLFIFLLENKKIKFSLLTFSFFTLCILFLSHILDPILYKLQDIWFFFTHLDKVWNDNSSEIIGLFSGRWGIWRANLKMFLYLNPLAILFGNGVGTSAYIAQQAGIYVVEAHNAYICLLIDFGLINFILLSILIISMFIKSAKMLKTKDKFLTYAGKSWFILLSAYSVLGVGTHIFYHVAISVWMFWAICGSFTGLYLNLYKK